MSSPFNKFLLNSKYNQNNNSKSYKYKQLLYVLKHLYRISGGIIASFLIVKDNSDIDFMTMGFGGFVGYLCPTLSFILGGGYLLKIKYDDIKLKKTTDLIKTPINKATDLLTNTINEANGVLTSTVNDVNSVFKNILK